MSPAPLCQKKYSFRKPDSSVSITSRFSCRFPTSTVLFSVKLPPPFEHTLVRFTHQPIDSTWPLTLSHLVVLSALREGEHLIWSSPSRIYSPGVLSFPSLPFLRRSLMVCAGSQRCVSDPCLYTVFHYYTFALSFCLFCLFLLPL